MTRTAIATLVAALASPMPTFAQDALRNDYGVLFERYPQSVETRTGDDGRRIDVLTHPGGVVVQRGQGDDGPVYYAIDLNETGAVGCMMVVAIELSRAARACPQDMTDAQHDRLGKMLIRLARFYAANKVPATTEADVLAAVADLSRQGGSCERLAAPPTRQLLAMIDAPGFDGLLSDMLTLPRPPVVNPCFGSQ